MSSVFYCVHLFNDIKALNSGWITLSFEFLACSYEENKLWIQKGGAVFFFLIAFVLFEVIVLYFFFRASPSWWWQAGSELFELVDQSRNSLLRVGGQRTHITTQAKQKQASEERKRQANERWKWHHLQRPPVECINLRVMTGAIIGWWSTAMAVMSVQFVTRW